MRATACCRFRDGDEQTWDLQVERTIARRQQEAVFAFTPTSERGIDFRREWAAERLERRDRRLPRLRGAGRPPHPWRSAHAQSGARRRLRAQRVRALAP